MMETKDAASSNNEMAVNPANPKSRRNKLIVGVAALVVLLAGAAFVGGRLLNNQSAQANGRGGLMIQAGPGGGGQAVSLEIQPAKELPTAPPDAMGLFAERKDNSLFVTMGNKFMVQVDKDGTVNTQTEGNGDKLEVVVTGDTTIYKDVTQAGLDGPPPSDGKVQQQVAPGSLDEIGSNSFVSAWGERRGDRVIARVLMYSQPMMIKRP
jgi:hypothetical protein